jgi:hypothetical protein
MVGVKGGGEGWGCRISMAGVKGVVLSGVRPARGTLEREVSKPGELAAVVLSDRNSSDRRKTRRNKMRRNKKTDVKDGRDLG